LSFRLPLSAGGMDSTDLLIAAGLLAALAVLWRASVKYRRRLPFTRRASLLTAEEMRFYRALRQVVPSNLAVCVQVRLLDVVWVPVHAWRAYGAKGSGMHLDYVLADAASLEPCLVIELDDRSHAQPQALRRDDFKNAALSAAGLPLLRIPAAGRYDLAELKA